MKADTIHQPSTCGNAPSALGSFVGSIPRALPWAEMHRHVEATGMSARAKISTKSIPLGLLRLSANGASYPSPGTTATHSSPALKGRPNA